MTFPWLLFDRIETRIPIARLPVQCSFHYCCHVFSLSFIIKIFPEVTTLGIPQPVDSIVRQEVCFFFSQGPLVNIFSFVGPWGSLSLLNSVFVAIQQS